MWIVNVFDLSIGCWCETVYIFTSEKNARKWVKRKSKRDKTVACYIKQGQFVK